MRKTDYLVENEEAIITIDLTHDGQFVTADNSLYSYKLTDNQGNTIVEEKDITIPADIIEEIKTVCWCGRAARCNARFNEHGIVREGEQVVLGGNDSYIALCRKHLKEGNLGPDFKFRK